MIERDKSTRVKHMGIDKLFLIRIILEDEARGKDWRGYLVDFEGTAQEAVANLRKDPRTVLCACDCKKAEDGSCTGEKEEG